ncbi:MAG: hypothetical protein JWO58_1956 [Chitinophagaceae bacterium]|nr:hypothetical protein [Chitinophagaceae bacterium]
MLTYLSLKEKVVPPFKVGEPVTYILIKLNIH